MGTEPQQPEKTEVPEQPQSETAESSRTQVGNANSTLFDIYLDTKKRISTKVDRHSYTLSA